MKIPSDTLSAIDVLIRKGKGGLAQHELRLLAKKKVPRSDMARVAQLAWRSNLPDLGIKILNPIVRPKPKSPYHASSPEKAEYAQCLIKIGAGDEALALLKTIESESLPEVWMYETSALMTRWDYAATLPLLEKYTASAKITPYQRLVGQLNLASALAYEREHTRADKLLREILKEARKEGLDLLAGAAIQAEAVNALREGNFEKAEKLLDEAESQLKHSAGIDEFFVRKWKAILNFVRSRPGRGPLEHLNAIRNEAIERAHWETVRDCDAFEASHQKDERLLLHVYFGTPFESFRQRLLKDFGAKVSLPEFYQWELGEPGVKKGKEFDLLLGHFQAPGKQYGTGKLLHRLLLTLSMDFYRPLRLPALHFRLYPEEFFNPTSSASRVYFAVSKLKDWLTENKIPLGIETLDRGYRLVGARACVLKVTLHRQGESGEVLELKNLKKHWPQDPFSVTQGMEVLRKSYSSVFRLLEKGCEKQLVRRTGSGRATRYKF